MGPSECYHVCVALSGCRPIEVTVALRVLWAIVAGYTEKDQKSPGTEREMSGQFSAPVNKWMYYSPTARASVTLCGKRGRSMTAIIGTGSVGHL